MKQQYQLLILQVIVPLAYGFLYYLLSATTLVEPIISTGLFITGLYLGELILFFDNQWLYRYYQPVKKDEDPVPQLITRSIVFVLSLVPLGIFIVTSTGSPLGVGVLLGILLGLLAEMSILQRHQARFKQRYLFQLSRPATAQDISWYIRLFLVYTLVFSILVLV